MSDPTMTAELLLAYLWTATGKDPSVRVCDLFAPSDPLVRDVEDAIAAISTTPAPSACGDPEHPLGAYCTVTTGLHTCYPPEAAISTPPPSLDVCPGKPAPGRWAFLDTETGDWIEVKAGTVHVRRRHPMSDHAREALLAEFDGSVCPACHHRAHPMSDGTRLNEFLAALPPSPERTQALVDLNALLTELNDCMLAAISTTPAETLPDDAEGHLAVVLAAIGPWTKYETSGQFARAILAEWNRQATAHEGAPHDEPDK